MDRRTADDFLGEGAIWSWIPLEESIALKYTTDPEFEGWIFMSPDTPLEGCREGQVVVHVHQWARARLPSAFQILTSVSTGMDIYTLERISRRGRHRHEGHLDAVGTLSRRAPKRGGRAARGRPVRLPSWRPRTHPRLWRDGRRCH